jgi:hypothetical protein
MPNPLPYALRTEEQKEAAREATRRYRAAHPDMMAADNEKTQARRRALYRMDEAYREKCKARSRATPPSKQREYRQKLKDQVLNHYGRRCACCGETEEFFLTLGHINQDGAAHRRKVNGADRGGATARLFLDIIRRGFPDDIRIECYNCNCGAFRNGGICPHVKLRQAPLSATA